MVNSGTVSTTTGVASSLNPSTYKASVKFTATVTPSAATGTVTFKDGTTTLGTGTLSGGVATYTTTSLAVGTHSITAVYGGATGYNGSTSSAVSQVVNKANTTSALVSSLNPSTSGASVKFTATVTPTTATGTVTFKNGTTTLGTGTLSSGVATYTTTTLPVGTDSITAVYGGSSSYNGSTSAALNQVVNAPGGTLSSITLDWQYDDKTSVNLVAAATSPVVVTLSSSDSTVVWVPASVTIPTGAITAETGSLLGSIWGQSPSSKTATITATYNGVQKTLTNAYGALQEHNLINCTGSCTVSGGSGLSFLLGTAFGSGPVGGAPVAITSDNLAIVPNQTTTLPAGVGYYNFNVNTNAGQPTSTVNVTFTFNGIVNTVAITVTNP